MKKRYSAIFVALAVILFATTFVHAAVPHLIRFQGKVTDKAGAPLNGSYNITFRVYDAVTGGTLKWSETQSAIPVNNGIFTALLGNATQPNGMDLPFSAPYWLSMEVNSDGEMAPRQQLSSVGYAIHAETAETFLGGSAGIDPAGAILLWTGANCPQGYSRATEFDGKFIVSGATYNAAAGGNEKHKHIAGTYATSSHSHSIEATTANEYAGGGTIPFIGTHNHGGVTGSAGAGPISGESGEADLRPPFAIIIFCKKL